MAIPARSPRFTRGKGLLEPLLARWRANQANRLIPDHLRQGRILDIGCGSFPYFLAHTSFKEKFAVDQLALTQPIPEIHWHHLHLDQNPHLPFPDRFFSVMTMLAVVEHLNPTTLIDLFQETYRTVQPGGMVILTTPAAWSDGLLRLMARLNLVSAEEINEHQYTYTLPLLGWYFGRAGFAMDKVHFGYFEMGLNLWAMAERAD
jgi:SAM-dependent methyltransferase